MLPTTTVLRVAPSTYYEVKGRPPSARAVRDAELKDALLQLWQENYCVYGVRKLHKAARRAGHQIGRDQTARLMRALGNPPVVLPTHWDNYFVPFTAPQDTSVARLQSFVREVLAASPQTRVIIPKYFIPITIPALKK